MNNLLDELKRLLYKNEDLRICSINFFNTTYKPEEKKETYFLIKDQDCQSFVDKSVINVYLIDLSKYVSISGDKLDITRSKVMYIRTDNIKSIDEYTIDELIFNYNNFVDTLEKMQGDIYANTAKVSSNIILLNNYLNNRYLKNKEKLN